MSREMPVTSPMATRIGGPSQPRSTEYRRKKIAAKTSAMPAIHEKSFTPTRLSQSKLGLGCGRGGGGGSGGGGGDGSGNGISARGNAGAPVPAWAPVWEHRPVAGQAPGPRVFLS